jgi:transcriptional regulator with XRE-family HTH domain
MSQEQLDPVIVGMVIARFRQEKGITQEVLSGLADIGRTHLSAIERGERKPTLETLFRISSALEVPMSTIVLALEDEMKKKEHRTTE